MTFAVALVGIAIGFLALVVQNIGGILMATAADANTRFDALKTSVDTLVQLVREIADVLRSNPSQEQIDALVAKIDTTQAEVDQVLTDTKDVDPTP